jgi:hypothetical protein
LAVIIAAELAAFYLLLRGCGWAFDDNLYLELAQQHGFSWQWLNSNLYGHWAPGFRAVFSVQNQLMPIDYRWALVLMLLSIAVCAYLLQRIVRMLVGGAWISVFAAAYFGVSVILIRPLQWWSFGLQAFPTLVADLLCVFAYLRYQREHAPRWVVVAAVALAGGLLFYEKPIAVLLYLVLLRALLLEDDLHPRALLRTMWGERAMWVALAMVGVFWAIAYQIAGGPQPHGAASLHEWLVYWRVFWGQALVPALFGVSLPAFRLNAGQTALAVVAQIILLGLVVVSIRRKPSAWRAWAALAVCVLGTGVLVATSRLAVFGSGFGDDPRFLLDFAWLVPLFVSVAVSRRDPPLTPLAEGHVPRQRPVVPRRPVLVAASALGLLYFGVSLATGAKVQHKWLGSAARRWEQNAQLGLGALLRGHRRVIVADYSVPYYMFELPGQFATLARILPHYAPAGAHVDGPLDGPLVALDARGRPHPATILPVTKVASAGASCLGRGRSPSPVERRFPAPLMTVVEPYYLRLRYVASGTAGVPLWVDAGAGLPGLPDRIVGLEPGNGQSIGWLGSGSLRAVRVQDIPAVVCIRAIDVVTVRPMDTPSPGRSS